MDQNHHQAHINLPGLRFDDIDHTGYCKILQLGYVIFIVAIYVCGTLTSGLTQSLKATLPFLRCTHTNITMHKNRAINDDVNLSR